MTSTLIALIIMCVSSAVLGYIPGYCLGWRRSRQRLWAEISEAADKLRDERLAQDPDLL